MNDAASHLHHSANHDVASAPGGRRLVLPSGLSAIPEGAVPSQATPLLAPTANQSKAGKLATAPASKPAANLTASTAEAVTRSIASSGVVAASEPGRSIVPVGGEAGRPNAGAPGDAGRSTSGGDAGRVASPKQTSRIPAIDGIVPLAAASANTKGPRQLFVVRHGERVDFTFGKDWVSNSFNNSGERPRMEV